MVDCITYFDYKFEIDYRERLKKQECEKYAPHNPCEIENRFSDIGTVYFEEKPKPTLRLEDGCYTGYNTGAMSIALAICKGYKRIYIFGIDCLLLNGNSHFHGGYGFKMQAETYGKMIWTLEIIGKFAKENGVELLNCSYNSLLDRDIFPYYGGFNG